MVKTEEKTLPKMNTNGIGNTVRCALERAQQENRVVIGLPAVVKDLAAMENDAIFCILAPPAIGDSAMHMNEILLEAFCYENDIYIIKVDSSKKLSRILGRSKPESCVLIQKPWLSEHQTENVTLAEDALVDHCEEFWDSAQQPVIRLPE